MPLEWKYDNYAGQPMYAGHLTVTYAVRGMAGGRAPVLKPLAPLLVGAFLPDLIDKPLCYFFGLPPRGVGHSALVLAFMFLCLFRLSPRRRPFLFALAAGAAFHLAEDWPFAQTLLWPLLGGWDYYPLFSLDEGLLTYYTGQRHPYMLVFEAASWPLCTYYWLRARLAADDRSATAPA